MEDKLTPEEEAELQALEAEYGAEEAPLSAEEEAELAQLEAAEASAQEQAVADKEGLGDSLRSVSAIAEAGAEMERDPAQAVEGMSTLEKIGEIASDQIPFADQLRAGAVSFYNQQFGEGDKTYSQVKNEIDAKQAAIQSENPVLATGTRIGTEIAQLATGTALISKGLKGVQFASKLGKVAKAATAAIGADLAFNVSQELSQDDRDMIEKLDDAFIEGSTRTAQGAIFGLALGKTLKYSGRALKATGIDKAIKDRIIGNNVAGVLKSQAKKLRGYTKNYGRDMSDIRKSLEEVGGEALDYTKPMDIVEFVEKHADSGSEALQKAGQMQGDVVSKITAATGKSLTGDAIEDAVSSKIDTLIAKQGDIIDESYLQNLGAVKDFVRKKFYNPDLTPKMADASQLMLAKQSIKEFVEAQPLQPAIQKQLLKESNDAINATVEAAAERFDLSKAVGEATEVIKDGKATESLLNQFKTARQRYQDINLLSDIVDTSNAEVGADKVFGAMRKAFYTTLPGGQGLMAVGAMGAVANTLLKSPQVLGRVVGSGTSSATKNLSKAVGLGKFLAENADTIPAMGALSSRIYTLFTDPEIDFKDASDEFQTLVDQGNSFKNLYEMPVARNNQDAKRKIEDIYNVIASTSPTLGKTLMDAYKNGEDLGPILVEVAKRPEAKGLFQEGVGWEGKVYSPQDKEAAIQQLRSYQLVPAADRLRYEQNIQSTGNLPEWRELPQREPIKLVPSNKGKGSY